MHNHAKSNESSSLKGIFQKKILEAVNPFKMINKKVKRLLGSLMDAPLNTFPLKISGQQEYIYNARSIYMVYPTCSTKELKFIHPKYVPKISINPNI